MALLAYIPFDDTTTVLHVFNSVDGAPIIGAFGRNGTNGLQLQTGGANGDNAIISLPSNEATLVVGFWFNPFDILTSADLAICALLDASSVQVDLRMTPQGRLYFTRNGTQIGDISTQLLFQGVGSYIEIKVLISDTVGTVELKVNEVQWLSTGTLDTKNTANAYANAVRLSARNGSAGAEYRFDDFVVINTSGDAPTNFIGDIRVEFKSPNANGTHTDFTAVGAATVALAVDDTNPDKDTTYGHSSTVGHKATFTHSGLVTTSGTVHVVGVLNRHRKDDAGTRTYRSTVKSGGVDANAASINSGDTYARNVQSFIVDPNTAAAWSIAAVNAVEFGAELMA